MALEDDFCDIVRKARYGSAQTVAAVAARAGLDEARLKVLEGGETPSSAEVASLAAALGLRQAPLADIAFGRWQPAPVGGSFGDCAVTAFFAEQAGAFVYALRLADRRIAIDAGGRADDVRQALGGRIDAVLLTHGHHDHVEGLAAMRDPGTAVYAHPSLAAQIAGAQPMQDGEEVLGLRLLASPGHSDDMLTIVGPGFAFVGDTLFAGSLGRAREPRNYPEVLRSARAVLALPAATALYPGHGPATTVGEERVHNAFDVA